MPLEVRIINNCLRYPAPRRQLLDVLQDACKGRARQTLTVILVDDREMRALNKRHKRRKESTDVLAFADGEKDPDSGIVHLGDIIVSVATARKEANLRGMRIRDEVTLYALHGLLHLTGMRDSTREESQEMVAAQARIFARNGLTYFTD